MKSLKITISLFFFLFSIAFVYAQTTAIKAGNLIDPENGKILKNKVILVEGKRIVAIINANESFEADKIIDLSNQWVSPGLIDCHVHLTLNSTYRSNDVVQRYSTESDAYRVLRGVDISKQLLQGGFTTVKEIGNDGNYATSDLIKAIKKGWVIGPTIDYAGKIIAPYGGQIDDIAFQNGKFWQREYIDADTHDEIRKAIRINAYYGATSIKLVTDSQKYGYSKEDIEVAVKEAALAGMKVSVHAGGNQWATNAIAGGAASIEHGFFLTEDQLKLMKEKATFLVGTDFSFDNWYAYGMDSIKAQKLYDITKNRLKMAYELGVKMAFGSDIIINLPGKNRLESNLAVLTTWKEAGIPPMHILKCMTSNAAELLGMIQERGILKKGHYADIIAFNKNPLDDIYHISNTIFVMKEGKIALTQSGKGVN